MSLGDQKWPQSQYQRAKPEQWTIYQATKTYVLKTRTIKVLHVVSSPVKSVHNHQRLVQEADLLENKRFCGKDVRNISESYPRIQVHLKLCGFASSFFKINFYCVCITDLHLLLKNRIQDLMEFNEVQGREAGRRFSLAVSPKQTKRWLPAPAGTLRIRRESLAMTNIFCR